jgi:tetratricopeptide (TPR) repeat protein
MGGNRPGPGGIGGNRPGPGSGGNRPGGGLVGQRPGGGPNRPGIGDNLGIGNRPNIGNNVNRPINSGNTNINRPTNISNVTNNTFTNVTSNNINNFTNINRPGYGGGGRWGGGYGGFRPSPYAAYHAGWVNGFWNGNYARGWGFGWNNWGLNALGLGMGMGVAAWGLGSLWNTWGYSTFANPYYAPAAVVQPTTVVMQPVVYDYSRPLDVTRPPPAQSVVDQAVAGLDSARASFQAGDYAQALKLADQAVQQTPNDPTLHEFRAICLFALGRYDDAAAPMYSVLSTGPGWDWTTLAGLYSNIDVYTQQLRDLEAYCNANPQAASARFLLAALYMTQGSNDAAAGILKQVVALQPRDNLSAQLLAALTANPPADQSEAPPTPEQPPGAPTAVAAQPGSQPAPNQAAAAGAASDTGPALPSGPVPANLIGTWTGSPAAGVTISLALDQNQGFTWKVTDRGQSRQFQGAATFDNDVLALTPPDQPPMVGTIAWKDDAHFQFKAVGAPASDPGLTFGK